MDALTRLVQFILQLVMQLILSHEFCGANHSSKKEFALNSNRSGLLKEKLLQVLVSVRS